MSGELSTSPIKIGRLRSKLLDGNIKLPPFQRDFVWKKDQVIDLLDSIKNDYPIGSILLWESKDKLAYQRDIGGYKLPDVEEDYPVNYVLDGQQRITSIFGVFAEGEIIEDTLIEQDIFQVFYDLREKIFITDKPEDEGAYIPLNILFNNSKFIAHIIDLDEKARKSATDLQSIFQNYEVPTVTIKKRSKDEVGLIFERINNTGTKLSSLELMIAWTWAEEFNLRDAFENIFDILVEKNFGDIKEKVILQCLGAIIRETTKIKFVLELKPQSVRDSIENLTRSLEKAIDFISTQFNCTHLDFLPRVQMLVPLVYFFNQTNSVDAVQSKKLKQWFWSVAFSDRYSASTDQRMDDDIIFMKKISQSNFKDLREYTHQLSVDGLTSIVFSKSNSYVKAFLLLMAQKNPKDLTNGQSIDYGRSLSIYNRKEYHHIFPKAFLKSKVLSMKEINKMINFCLLPANSNKIISNKKPSEYFNNIIPQESKVTILESNLIPNDDDIYEKDDYDLFIFERSKIVLAEVNALTEHEKGI
jgi:hypothetical protein